MGLMHVPASNACKACKVFMQCFSYGAALHANAMHGLLVMTQGRTFI